MTITPDSPILNATPQATSQQCSRYLLARPHGEYTEQDIAGVIVPAYFAVCAAVGADPLLLIAQMIHETGNLCSAWSARPHRNPAGLGVTGQPGQGLSFPTWKDDAIPAHVGRLLAYAVTDEQANAAQKELIAKALSYRPLPDRYRGCAPTLSGLVGTWANPGKKVVNGTLVTYADSIARIANAIQSG